MKRIFILFILCLLSLTSCTNIVYNDSDATVVEVKTSVTEIIKKVEGGCVAINATLNSTSSLGSGVIFKKENDTYYFLTNYHVIGDYISDTSSKYKVYVTSNTNVINAYILYDSKGNIVGDSNKDLAVMYFKSNSNYQVIDIDPNLTYKVSKGESVIAIGCPISLENYNLVSIGNVSLEEYKAQNNSGYVNVIEHSATINPGNSGGGLFNINGDLIGINFKGTTAVKEGESYVVVSGVYYAIALSSVKEFLNDYSLI